MNSGNFGGQGNVDIFQMIFSKLNGPKKKGTFFGFLKWLILVYLVYGLVLLFSGALILDFTISIRNVVGPFILVSLIYGISHEMKKLSVLGAVVGIIFVIANVVFSPIVSYKSHRDLIGNVEEIEFSNEIDYIDLNQLPTIDTELASKLADKKLGEIPSLGSQVTIGELHLQSINGELYYVAPLEHSSFIKWLTNMEGTAGYVKVSATNQNDVQLVTELDGQELKIKYLDSAYLFSDLTLSTYLRDLTKGHIDYTFELDDNGKPYWVVTRYDTAVGFSEAKAIGVLVMDAQTGEAETYSIEDAPEWIDRIQPASFIKNYIDKWGELVHGVFNFGDKDKLTSTEDMNVIYNDNTCYFYTGVTSVGSDESLVGFTLTDTRTGETTIYKTSGATEYAAMKSAQGKVQQFGYSATFPYLINVQGEATYFTTLKDSNGLVKQYAMVNVKNYNTVAVGDTLQTTLNKYIEALTNTNISLEGSNKELVIEGNIERIGLVIKDGTSIYDIKLTNSDNIFSVSTETSREVALSKIGDSVKIKYVNVGSSKYIIVNGFENIESPALNSEEETVENEETTSEITENEVSE